jgi:hypothetical protein
MAALAFRMAGRALSKIETSAARREIDMTTHTTMHSLLGMLHAQELLTISLIRSLPPDIRLKIADEFQAQVERSEQPNLSPASERETLDAFRTHIRKLSILLASLS